MAKAEIAKKPNATARLPQIGTPARNEKPEETCPTVLTASTKALRRPAFPRDMPWAEVRRSGSAKAIENIWQE
jgi:hypothetical protein